VRQFQSLGEQPGAEGLPGGGELTLHRARGHAERGSNILGP
jgi:hypothetical protein